jgi:predicted acyl esterase
MIEEKDVLIRVRDGMNMAARIYRPECADTIYHDADHPSELVLPVLK